MVIPSMSLHRQRCLYAFSCAAGKLSTSEVSKFSALSWQAVYKKLRSLERSGLVREVPYEETDGTRHWELTENGEKVLGTILGQAYKMKTPEEEKETHVSNTQKKTRRNRRKEATARNKALENRKAKAAATVQERFAAKNREIPENYTITAKVETITPEKAAEYSAKSCGNRPESKSNLDHLKKVMLADEFYLLPDPLVISVSGKVMNAHHRLEACRQTGKTIQLLVVRGIPDELFPFLDTNRKLRNQADALAIAKGISDKTFRRLQSTLQMLYDYSCSTVASRHKISNDEMIVLDELYPNAEFWTSRLHANKNPLALGAACAAFAIIENAGNDRDEVTAFSDGVQTGAGLPANSPGLALRNRIIALRTGVDKSKKGVGAKHRGITTQISRIEVMRLIIHCWNKHVDGLQVKNLNCPSVNLEPKVIKRQQEEEL